MKKNKKTKCLSLEFSFLSGSRLELPWRWRALYKPSDFLAVLYALLTEELKGEGGS